MDTIDKRVLKELQFSFPLCERPYRAIARKLKTKEEIVLARTRRLKKKKLIKYIGAVFNSSTLGCESTLIAAKVARHRLRHTASVISRFEGVSHNYLRSGSPFNLWFTLTAAKGTLKRQIKKIKKAAGIDTLRILKSKRMYKVDTRFTL